VKIAFGQYLGMPETSAWYSERVSCVMGLDKRGLVFLVVEGPGARGGMPRRHGP
jgi:hypothetical protein